MTTSATAPFKLDATGARRLEKLAVFLDALPTTSFNIGHWIRPRGGNNNADHSDLYRNGVLLAKLKPEQLHACGTTACAFGWAAMIPSFRRAGLVLDGTTEVPSFEGVYGFHAASKFFHLDQGGRDVIAEGLFSGAAYDTMYFKNVTPKMVAGKIRKVLKDPAKFYADHAPD